jgi:choline monooxygenase
MTAALDALLARFDPTLPLERARTIPAAWYHDPELAVAERQRVFGNTWQCVAVADHLPGNGSFFTFDLAGEPILLVRDGAELRGFYNVCRHRGAQVAAEAQGCASRFRCRYHGWTYDLAGRLRGVPEFERVADFRREDNGLVGVRAGPAGPLLWVHLGGDPAPLEDWVAPVRQRGSLEALAGFRWHSRREYRLACNWKVYVDNYLDGGYHVNTVHQGLAGVLDYPNYHTEIEAHASVQLSPMRQAGADDTYNEVRSGQGAFYWWVFPNLMLNVYDAAADTNLVLPDGPDACRVIFDYWFRPGALASFIERSLAVTHEVQVEDVGICEEVQRGLKSRSFDTGRYSARREAGVYHFHQLLARWLRG